MLAPVSGKFQKNGKILGTQETAFYVCMLLLL